MHAIVHAGNSLKLSSVNAANWKLFYDEHMS